MLVQEVKSEIPSIDEQLNAMWKVHNESPNHPVRPDSMPAPASALAMPVETARSETNANYVYLQMMAPSRDGIYAINSTTGKTSSAKDTAKINMSAWGF